MSNADGLGPLTETELNTRFTHHTPVNESQVDRYTIMRQHGRRLAAWILDNVPRCQERSMAIHKIEEAVMWVNAGIARREGAPGPEIDL